LLPDAERPGMRSHAERGNEKNEIYTALNKTTVLGYHHAEIGQIYHIVSNLMRDISPAA